MVNPHREALAATYDDRAQIRQTYPIEQWKIDVASRFLESLPAAPLVLDVGAGTGVFSSHFMSHGAAVLAIDISEQHVDICRQKGINAFVSDVTTDDLAVGEFDGAWAMNSLLHVPKSQFSETLERIRDALRPNGLLMMCQWGGEDFEGTFSDDPYDPPRFFSLLSDESMSRLSVPGMETVSFTTLPADKTRHDHHPQIVVLERTI